MLSGAHSGAAERYDGQMPNIGPLELAIVLIIALVIFGPKRLPELGRSLGNGLREFKSSVSGDHDEPDEPEVIENEPDITTAAYEDEREPAATGAGDRATTP